MPIQVQTESTFRYFFLVVFLSLARREEAELLADDKPAWDNFVGGATTPVAGPLRRRDEVRGKMERTSKDLARRVREGDADTPYALLVPGLGVRVEYTAVSLV